MPVFSTSTFPNPSSRSDARSAANRDCRSPPDIFRSIDGPFSRCRRAPCSWSESRDMVTTQTLDRLREHVALVRDTPLRSNEDAMKSTRIISAAVALALFSLVVQARAAGAAEITVLCSVGLKAVMDDLAPKFEQATKHK